MKPDDRHEQDLFKVPDGYFERLPEVISSRVHRERGIRRSIFKPVYAYAALVVLIALVVLRINRSPMPPDDAVEILASIETEALIDFLEESDISVEEIFLESGTEGITGSQSEQDVPADVIEEFMIGTEIDTL